MSRDCFPVSAKLGPALLLAALALGGCEGIAELGKYTPRTAGPAPLEANSLPPDFRNQIRDFMRTYLIDPTGVREAYVADPVMMPVAGNNRYVACVRYNARDSDKKYMGSKDSVAIFLGGRLNQFLEATREQCGAARWQPYPELQTMVP